MPIGDIREWCVVYNYTQAGFYTSSETVGRSAIRRVPESVLVQYGRFTSQHRHPIKLLAAQLSNPPNHQAVAQTHQKELPTSMTVQCDRFNVTI